MLHCVGMDVVDLPNLFEETARRACLMVPRLAHVDPAKILVLAHRLPHRRLGQTVGFRAQRRLVRAVGSDALYAMSFSARLVALGSVREHDALDTVMHELWHVAEACDGTIRPMRHGVTFDAIVRTMRRAYLRAGGEPLPELAHDVRVRVRQMGLRADASGAFDVRERITALGKLVPVTIEYVCPFGHVVVRSRRLARPSSCASCSKRFDPRFLLQPLAAN